MIQYLLNKLGTKDASLVPDGDFMNVCFEQKIFIDGGGCTNNVDNHSWSFWVNYCPPDEIKDCFSDVAGDVRVSTSYPEGILYRILIHNEEDRNKIVDYLLNERFCLTKEETDLVLAIYQMENL
jgi:hypothetical protein